MKTKLPPVELGQGMRSAKSIRAFVVALADVIGDVYETTNDRGRALIDSGVKLAQHVVQKTLGTREIDGIKVSERGHFPAEFVDSVICSIFNLVDGTKHPRVYPDKPRPKLRTNTTSAPKSKPVDNTERVIERAREIASERGISLTNAMSLAAKGE